MTQNLEASSINSFTEYCLAIIIYKLENYHKQVYKMQFLWIPNGNRRSFIFGMPHNSNSME